MAATPVEAGRRTIVGINFGNAYASISVINKEGFPDCIANEDGERQIAAAVSYSGEEVYIGNQAKPQLVKNSQNTITGFRNLLGKKFSDIAPIENSVSASIVDLNGEPGYTVEILLPAPKPSAPTSTRSTPAPTRAPSPPAPIQSTKSLTVSEVASLFLSTLKRSAEDFLGKPIEGAVLSVPESWDQSQLDALRKAAENAGINVLQLAAEEGLAVLGSESAGSLEATPEAAKAPHDRTTLVLDLGSSTLTLNLLSIKQSLVHPLASLVVPGVGGDAIDDALIQHFAKEFTKKTKVPLSLPAQTPEDRRAEAKLRLAVEHTKRTLSASAGAASCSVESLKDGIDFSGTINRLRFDVLLATLYARVTKEVDSILSSGGVSKEEIDEVLLVGGSAGLSGLAEKLELFFGENSRVSIRSDLDSSQLIANGAVAQAKILTDLPQDDPLHAAFAHASEVVKVSATSKPIGLVFAGSEENTIPVVVIPSETPLPVRRVVRFPVASGAARVAFEVWEGEQSLRDLPKEESPRSSDPEDEEDEEEEEEEPLREVIVTKSNLFGGLAVDLVAPQAPKGAKAAPPSPSLVEVRVDVETDGSITVSSRQASENNDGEWQSFSVGK